MMNGNIKKMLITGLLLMGMILLMAGCGEQPSADLTEEQAYNAVQAYCPSTMPELSDESLTFGWNSEGLQGEEYKITFRSYTGAYVYYYVDVKTGDVRAEEYAPSISDEIVPTDETFNAWDYL